MKSWTSLYDLHHLSVIYVSAFPSSSFLYNDDCDNDSETASYYGFLHYVNNYDDCHY